MFNSEIQTMFIYPWMWGIKITELTWWMYINIFQYKIHPQDKYAPKTRYCT